MDEKTQEKTKGETEEKTEETSKKEEEGIVEQIRKEREALEKTKEELKVENAKLQKSIAEAQMQGRSFAGQATKEPTIKDKAKEFWKGTDIEKAIEKHG